MERSGLESSGSLLSSSLTQAGSIVGTPRYMAPEQHLGGAVDVRSDQFSFCVVLFEALFGKRPFAGKRLSKFVENVTGGKVVELEDNKGVPDWLTRVVLRGLRADPPQRHSSLADLLRELDNDPELARRAARAKQRRWLLAGAVALLVLLVGGGGAW